MPSTPDRSFTALHIVATIFSALAWASLAIVPLVAAATAFYDKNGIPFVAAFLLGIIPGGIGWLVLMFTAQSITVLLAIEENTRVRS